jgi:hypothetical protein
MCKLGDVIHISYNVCVRVVYIQRMCVYAVKNHGAACATYYVSTHRRSTGLVNCGDRSRFIELPMFLTTVDLTVAAACGLREVIMSHSKLTDGIVV